MIGMLRKIASIALLVVGVGGSGYAAAMVTERQPAPTPEAQVQPYCPTEDSCVVDYRDGRWYVKTVTP